MARPQMSNTSFGCPARDFLDSVGPIMADSIDSTMHPAPTRFSSFHLAIQAAKLTFSTALDVLRETWPFLLGLQLLYGGANQFFSYAMNQLGFMSEEDLPLLATIAGAELIFTLVWSSFWVMVICSAAGRGQGRPMTTFPSRLNHLLIEQVRGLASIVWRMPFFLLPALIQYVRLAFVPFVVILDRAYDRGEVDALAASKSLSKGHFWLLGVTLLLSSVTPWLAEEMTRSGSGPFFSRNPIGVTLGWLLTLFINLIMTVFMLELFRSRTRPKPTL